MGCAIPKSRIVYEPKDVDTQIEFEGGFAPLMSFIFSNFHYQGSFPNDAPSRVLLRIFVQKDDTIKDIQIIKTSGSEWFDNEAIRVMKAAKGWKAATKGNKKVDSYMTYPIRFCLRG